MALAASDVFVVQKQAGGEIRKVTAQSLSDYLASGDTVIYKGVGDFTDVSANPASPKSCDLWIKVQETSQTLLKTLHLLAIAICILTTH